MSRAKKTFIVLVAGLCSAVIILSALVLLSPWILDKTILKSTVCREVSRLIDGNFSYSKTTLSLFPAPHVVLVNPQIEIPDKLSASVDTVEVYPELAALFSGSLVLRRTAFNRPNATIRLSVPTGGTDKHSSPAEISQILPKLLQSVSRLPKSVLSIDDGTISQGSVTLIYNQKTTLTFNNLDAEIENNQEIIALKINSTSNMFENLSVTASIHNSHPEGNAHIELEKFKLESFYNGLLPDAPWKIVDGAADIGVDITLQDNKNIDLNLKGSAPNIHLASAGQDIEIEVQSMAARINLTPSSVTITVSELALDNPSMNVSGNVRLSDQSPKLKIQLEGRNIDINSSRLVSLALAGTNRVTQTVSEIVKAGSIQLLTLSSQADSPADLAGFDNLVLQTSVANGTIDVPGTSLVLTGLSADVDLTKGVLTGKRVQAQWQKSTVKDGRLKIDLGRDPLPLDIAAGLTVDVADIPAILENVTKDQALAEKLKKLEDLKGNAMAAVALTGSGDQLKVNVSVSDLQLSARHKKIPLPLRIDSGGLVYDGSEIAWRKLHGSVGSSSFAAFSGSLDLGKTKHLEITSGSSDVTLSEVLPWTAQQLKKPEITNYYGGGESKLHLSRIKAGGPLEDFRKWHFDITGELEDLIIKNVPNDPGSARIKSLHFRFDPKTIHYSAGRLSLLDTTLTVSGSHQHYMKGTDTAISLVLEGAVGEKTTAWFSKTFKMPSWLKLRPLFLSRSELTYSNHSGHSLTASLDFQEDLKAFANVSMDGKEVIIKKLTISDRLSQVTLDGRYREPMLAISYDGNLQAATLNKLFHFDQTPANSAVDGKAQIHLNLKNTSEASLVGKLSGKNVSLPTGLKTPLLVKNISIHGTSETVSIESANLQWNDTAVILSGTVTANFPEKAKIDLDVEADSVDVEQIAADFEGEANVQGKKPVKTLSTPVVGTVQFKTKKLKTKDLTVQPLEADIQLQDEVANITIKKMGLCSIMTVGTVTFSPPDVDFYLKPQAQGQQLDATLDCFTDKHFKADGTFGLNGSIEGHGTLRELLKTTSGSVEFHISNGHIYHDIVLLNVLKFLNAAQVLTGRISSGRMLEKGIGFDRFETLVKLKEGTLEYEKIIFDGDEMKLSGTGKIDLFTKKIKFTLLMATQTAASALLGHVPLIGSALQAIATIPLTIEGTVDDVHVLPLAPSAVGYELREAARQAFGIPLHLVHLHDFHKKLKSDEK